LCYRYRQDGRRAEEVLGSAIRTNNSDDSFAPPGLLVTPDHGSHDWRRGLRSVAPPGLLSPWDKFQIGTPEPASAWDCLVNALVCPERTV
jgi:hypothetical protein